MLGSNRRSPFNAAHKNVRFRIDVLCFWSVGYPESLLLRMHDWESAVYVTEGVVCAKLYRKEALNQYNPGRSTRHTIRSFWRQWGDAKS